MNKEGDLLRPSGSKRSLEGFTYQHHIPGEQPGHESYSSGINDSDLGSSRLPYDRPRKNHNDAPFRVKNNELIITDRAGESVWIPWGEPPHNFKQKVVIYEALDSALSAEAKKQGKSREELAAELVRDRVVELTKQPQEQQDESLNEMLRRLQADAPLQTNGPKWRHAYPIITDPKELRVTLDDPIAEWIDTESNYTDRRFTTRHFVEDTLKTYFDKPSQPN